MRSIRVTYQSDAQEFEFCNRRGEAIVVSAAPGRPNTGTGALPTIAPRGDRESGDRALTTEIDIVGTTLGSGTLIGYLSRAAHETRLRLVVLTVLTESGEQVAGPVLSEQLDDDEARLIMRAAASADDPVSALRRFVTFRPERAALVDL